MTFKAPIVHPHSLKIILERSELPEHHTSIFFLIYLFTGVGTIECLESSGVLNVT